MKYVFFVLGLLLVLGGGFSLLSGLVHRPEDIAVDCFCDEDGKPVEAGDRVRFVPDLDLSDRLYLTHLDDGLPYTRCGPEETVSLDLPARQESLEPHLGCIVELAGPLVMGDDVALFERVDAGASAPTYVRFRTPAGERVWLLSGTGPLLARARYRGRFMRLEHLRLGSFWYTRARRGMRDDLIGGEILVSGTRQARLDETDFVMVADGPVPLTRSQDRFVVPVGDVAGRGFVFLSEDEASKLAGGAMTGRVTMLSPVETRKLQSVPGVTDHAQPIVIRYVDRARLWKNPLEMVFVGLVLMIGAVRSLVRKRHQVPRNP